MAGHHLKPHSMSEGSGLLGHRQEVWKHDLCRQHTMDHTMAISVASALVSLALARVVTQQSSVSPLTFTELLKQLHWLPHRMANPI